MEKPKKDKEDNDKVPKDTPTTPREHAKAMSKAARQVARENGKRITMSMFIIEDLV